MNQGTTIAPYQRPDGVSYHLEPQPAMIQLEGRWIAASQIASVDLDRREGILKDGTLWRFPKWDRVIDNMRVPQTIHL